MESSSSNTSTVPLSQIVVGQVVRETLPEEEAPLLSDSKQTKYQNRNQPDTDNYYNDSSANWESSQNEYQQSSRFPYKMQEQNEGVVSQSQDQFCIVELILNIIQIAALVAVIYGAINIQEQSTFLIFIGIGGAVYLMMLFIVLCGMPTAREIWGIKSHQSAESYINHYRQVNPKLTTTLQCYHHEWQEKITYKTDENGNQVRQRSTERVKVDTWHGTFEFEYDYVAERSPQCKLNEGEIFRIRIDQNIKFGDACTYFCYKKERTAFIQNNMNRDTNYDVVDCNYIPGVSRNLMCVKDLQNRHFMLDYWVYFVFVLLNLQFIYVFWLRKNCLQVGYTYTKDVFRRDRRFYYEY